MTTIQVSNTTREKLKMVGRKGQVYDQVIDEQIEAAAAYKFRLDSVLKTLKETTINQEGRFENSKALAGKTILYKVKEEQPNAKQS